jgi:RHH-type proline utilization regulon transcriptional repressor/proline dehydrogenase/delta 1-pyrroline-5-carboxylate dehydrogenase
VTPSWIFGDRAVDLPRALDGIDAHYLADEAATVRALAARARLPARESAQVLKTARRLVTSVRDRRRQLSALDAFMGQYDLSSQEGVALMCLAEALLRIPDAETADRLIADKLGMADFAEHLGTSESLFVNAATWGLMLTGRIVRTVEPDHERLPNAFGRAVGRLGEPVIRAALKQAMRILGQQFVMGRTIAEALERAGSDAGAYRYSFDMLGEAALTTADARRYMDAYAESIAAVGRWAQNGGSDLRSGRGFSRDSSEESRLKPLPQQTAPSVSVKLSALCPRFEVAQSARAVGDLCERLLVLAKLAKSASIALTVDAEEADRLALTLTIFEKVFASPALGAWTGLGLAVQAYQKRAIHVIEWLERLAAGIGRTIPVRLVKGAYWDTEIKRAQEQGLSGYPVFTRKSSTDVSYLACARRLLEASPHLYAQLATHNAHTVAWALRAAGDTALEFQRLHGMGDALYAVLANELSPWPCRVYAPVGSHEELLPYLVRRLLENGANTSFVNRIVDEDASVDEIVEDPVAVTDALEERLPHPRIPLPHDLFGAARRNSAGLNLSDPDTLLPLAADLAAAAHEPHAAAPIVAGSAVSGRRLEVRAPADRAQLVGETELADKAAAKSALAVAAEYFPQWNAVSAGERAARLRKAADLVEANRASLMSLCVLEAGRGIADSASEVREAVDFLRYYAHQCERLFGAPTQLPGPTGERNRLYLGGRGVFLCVSPWNFPIAIFTGQIAAALAAGNTVLAKPAEQTNLVAARVMELLYAAGIPGDALHFLPGDGPEIGAAVLSDARLAGVAFTGSTETARLINKMLAERAGPLATLIAETGGVNAMIVDSSALPEQVVKDAVQSAFNSAGQRCSALRLLCLQEETADRVLAMLEGCMAELVIGSPTLLRTDVGPVIDPDAQQGLLAYIERHRAQIRFRCELSDAHESGLFVPPTLIELEHVADLEGEVFGPVLHVVRYRADAIDAIIDDVNALGYGLTLGVHSRIDSFATRIADRARVGNVYVNRNMIGAVVGVQPFGGMGLSGTGPKAGGPHYLARFATEQTVTVNTAAVGGNATLLSLE